MESTYCYLDVSNNLLLRHDVYWVSSYRIYEYCECFFGNLYLAGLARVYMSLIYRYFKYFLINYIIGFPEVSTPLDLKTVQK